MEPTECLQDARARVPSEALCQEGGPAAAPRPRLDGRERSPGPDGPEPWLLPAPCPGRRQPRPAGGHPDRSEPDLPGQREVPEERGALPAAGPVQRAAGVRAPQPGCGLLPGYLILITKNEEESFWLLDALVGRILPDYYSPEMLGLKTDQQVLAELVRMKLPAVAALMDGHGVMWTLLVSRWFICLFVDILPVETVLRIWDCLFNEGSKIIFRVALTLIKQHQALILEAASAPDICDKFKQITRGPFVTECHAFMQKVFSEPGSLPMTTITKLRETCRAALLAQG